MVKETTGKTTRKTTVSKSSKAAPKKTAATKSGVNKSEPKKASIKKSPVKKVPVKKTVEKKFSLKTAKKTTSKKSYPWLKAYPKDIPWDVEIPEGPIYELLDKTAARFPDRPSIEFLGKRYTYAELGDLVNRAAKGLQDIGVKKGIKVGLFMPNAPYFVIFYYAILKAGGTVVNYSPLAARRELNAQIEDSETDIMVTLDLHALYPKVHEMLSQSRLKKIIVCPLSQALPFPKNFLFPILKFKEVAKIHWDKNHIKFSDLIQNDGNPKPLKLDLKKDVALLQYTGGTTGLPKGAMLSHANIFGNAHQAHMWFTGIKEGEERILAALPLFHVFAMTAVMNLAIKIGAEIVMMFPRFNVDGAMKMIQQHKITFFPAVPTIYTMINGHKKVSQFDLSSLKACLSGGAALPLEVKNQFEALTGCNLVEAYGLSETSPAATSNPLHGETKAGSIGIPFPGTTVRIMDLENPGEDAPLGERGEICIKGPQVMLGYWNRPAETASSLVEGYLHTGDVGYMDKEGYTFLVDRIKDLILCSGYNVYPRNLEEAIYLHPLVEEVTVIGVPDERRGEVPKAFIKLLPGKTLTVDDMKTFLKDKLSPIEMPRKIEFRDELPKTIIGKLSKKELVAEETKKFEEKKKES